MGQWGYKSSGTVGVAANSVQLLLIHAKHHELRSANHLELRSAKHLELRSAKHRDRSITSLQDQGYLTCLVTAYYSVGVG